ncbi:MAG TPA: HAMP domain-containing sensor histidine kinase [Solirubrobacteraceae bacterium]
MSRSSGQSQAKGSGFAGRSRRALGLRPRVFAALLLSSAVTLAVAALALLSPLEHRLRVDGESTVLAAASASRGEYSEIRVDPASGKPDVEEVAATTSLLRRRSGSQVTLFDNQLNVVYSPAPTDLDVPDYYVQLRRALHAQKPVHTISSNGDLVVVEPISIGGKHYALVLLKRLQYVSSAVQVVQKAFIEAAGVGFGIALLLGIGLTSTLLRRLERLRDAARELERGGLDVSPPADTGRDEIGELAGAFASMHARLRRQEEARRSFVATASHELRTPLTSLDGMLELLEDDLNSEPLDIEDARDRTIRARQQSRRLSQLASDLLDLSRLDAEVALRSEPVELTELARAVIAEFELTAHEREVSLKTRPTPSPCWANADPGAAARIVRILLDNALRVAPTGSSIEVFIRNDEHRPQVVVCDDGPGVAPSERELIFERFRRGADTAKSAGFGLGLAIGRELASRMGGELGLLEHPPSGDLTGACFALSLAQASDQGPART